jgi:hypothetical protein
VKNLARLVLFFSNSFILSFLLLLGIRFLFDWLEAVRTIPAQSVEPAAVLVAAAKASLSAAIYCAVLLSLSYTVRRVMPVAFSIFFVFLFTLVLSFAVSLLLNRLETVESTAAVERRTLGEIGLKLKSADVTIVVMGDPADTTSPRVIAMPDRPLIFQETPLPTQRLPSVPLDTGNSWFMTSLGLDFALASEQLFVRLKSGFFFFCIYLCSLALLLSSCRFVFELSAWPLANLFFGILVFRGILSFEIFLDSEGTQNLIGLFAGGLISPGFISPVIYTGLALLVIMYTLLVNAARGRRRT